MQLSPIKFLFALTLVCSQRQLRGSSHVLPEAVRLGGAIVAAVEQDVEQEERLPQDALLHFWQGIDEQSALAALERLFNETSIGSGRGKYHKQKKMIKYLYPLVMGILLAKTVLIPLTLKMLTAISASSFVMSKIALVASALLALKWIIGDANSGYEAKDRLEIIHLPAVKQSVTDLGWHDLAWSGSKFYDNNVQNYRQKYIPLEAGKDAVSFRGTYRYPQHNYNALKQKGKPFL